MIEFPHAKINLGLRILRKRNDGYHDIETVFYPVPLCDILEVNSGKIQAQKITEIPASKVIEGKSVFTGELNSNDINFSLSGIPVEGELTDNLCLRAYHIFTRETGWKEPLTIHLHKTIPSGAGLGGGSSDGAFMLYILDRISGKNTEAARLAEMASLLGSDCSFFLKKQPCFATGRGELLEEINVNLKGYSIVIVKPPFHVYTDEAYSNVKPRVDGNNIKSILGQPVESWKRILVNDFEESVFRIYPDLGEIKNKLYATGAVYASMSGSGSAMFGLYNTLPPQPSEFPDCFYFTALL
jgi:4-diphosphocytidyl-2-C-methyl-D-erythritol kinase